MEKEELLTDFDIVLGSTTSIKHHVDRIAELWTKTDGILDEREQELLVNRIKDRVQREAFHSLTGLDWQALYMATGVGKTRIAIMKIRSILETRPEANILIVVPTEKLRDNGWPEELNKWGIIPAITESWVIDKNITITCYASLAKIERGHYSLVVLDEGHNITENNVEFFKKNTVSKVILLTGTKPKDLMKLELLREMNINPAYTLSIDEATKLGIVAPYTITVITMNLDTAEKYLKAGSAKKGYFYNTEKNQYAYMSRGRMLYSPLGHINRMRFVRTLKSKTKAAKWILDSIIPKELRTIIFCGSKDQANQLCRYRYYSKPVPPKKIPDNATEAKKVKYNEKVKEYMEAIKYYQGDDSLTKFINQDYNQISCVEALNEGHNLPNLDIAFIVQLNSNELDFIQRVGRLIRYRFGHIGRVIILCVYDTVDKTWVEKALKNIKLVKVEWIELARLQAGIDKIIF